MIAERQQNLKIPNHNYHVFFSTT